MISLLYLGPNAIESAAWHEVVRSFAAIQCVAGARSFESAICSGNFHVILADAAVAQTDSPSPLEIARTLAPGVPVVLLAGDGDEARAISAIERGAFDSVPASSAQRIAIAVRRAAAERETREQLRRAAAQLRASEERCLAAENQIRQLNASWENVLAERTSASAAAMKELEAFSYSVSHDLRAPLRGILGFTRALKEDCGPQLGAEGLRLLDTIGNEARRMSHLIDDLLAFSRAGRQQIDRSDIDMTDLARSAFQTIVEAMREPWPELELAPLPAAEGDRSMLRQVFANLLGNAVKFSGSRAAPKIEISGSRQGAEIVYRIRDNGVGFDPRYAHRLFGVFQRLHREEEFEGTGVGLALVQRIVQRHGGRVWGESTLNEGASFYFALPAPLKDRADASAFESPGPARASE